MKKIYLSISICCLASISAIAQTTTPPTNLPPVTLHGQSVAAVCDGSATFNPPANVTAWQWFKDTTLVQTNGTLLGSLCGGSYSVKYSDPGTVTNMVSFPFSIGVGSATGTGTSGGGKGTCPTFEAHAVSTSVTAAGVCDGTTEIVIVKAGTAPYTYKWSNTSLTTKALGSLCASSIQMTATDAAGCIYTDSAHVPPFNSTNHCLYFKAHVVSTNESSPGACDGSATAVGDGGIAPFTYSWNNSNVTTKINPNLCSGIHVVHITDANGCVGSDSTVSGALAVNTMPCQFFAVRTLVTNDTAHTAGLACGGYVEAVCKGGTGPLTYVWSGNTANNTPFHQNACAGSYTVTVHDSLGCSATIHAYVGTNPPPMMPPTPGVMPLHLFVKTMDVTNAALCNGKAYAKADGGIAPYTFSFGGSSATGVYHSMDSLCAGFYTVNVMDANSATESFVFVIGSPATTFMPPMPPVMPPIPPPPPVDTLVASAISTCIIDYSIIDSIRITHVNFVATDSIKAIWTVFQGIIGAPTTHTFTQYYKVNISTGIVNCILDLFCTNRTSGSAKAQDQVDLGKLALGIQAIETINTTIYPNPFDNQLNVVTDKIATVNIIDVTGRNVYSGAINAGISTINTDILNSGMYFISIKAGQKMITKKLIKH